MNGNGRGSANWGAREGRAVSIPDIARLLGISPQAVFQHERQAIRALWRVGPRLLEWDGRSRVGSLKAKACGESLSVNGSGREME